MSSIDLEAMIVLGGATALALYLLVILAQLHYMHRSPAWAFIFTGLALLALECVGLVLERLDIIDLPRYALDLVVLTKAACYAIGFTIWKRNLKFADYLRRLEMAEKDKPQPPAPPSPPPTPAPAPAPKPTDEPLPPGVPEDPGKSGGHP